MENGGAASMSACLVIIPMYLSSLLLFAQTPPQGGEQKKQSKSQLQQATQTKHTKRSLWKWRIKLAKVICDQVSGSHSEVLLVHVVFAPEVKCCFRLRVVGLRLKFVVILLLGVFGLLHAPQNRI
jgi:hypothetical protein